MVILCVPKSVQRPKGTMTYGVKNNEILNLKTIHFRRLFYKHIVVVGFVPIPQEKM